MRGLFIPLALACCLFAARTEATGVCTARSHAEVVPLVELYTSEGCSSCPPADRWLSQRFAKGEANFLAFHVDYWDDIGWPDRFGSATFSQRQRGRVNAAGSTTVYTPQVMVGETVRANWHGLLGWKQTLRQARQPAGAALSLRLRRDQGGWLAGVGAAATQHPGEGAQLWLARYVDGQITDVRAGENRGVTLRHDRVVRELSGPWPLTAEPLSQRVSLPEETAPWGVTAFVQDSSGRILQSLNLHATGCAFEKFDATL